MKICFWIGSALYRQWGTSRVVKTVASEFAKTHEVYIVGTKGDTKRAAFFKDAKKHNLKIKKMPAAEKVYQPKTKGPDGLRRKLVRFANRKFGFFQGTNQTDILKDALCPAEYTEKFTQFFITQEYDVIIAVGREIYWLAVMANKLGNNIKKIGWCHNTYDEYVLKKNGIFWRKEEMIKKYFPDLDHLVLLNPFDAKDFNEKLGLNATSISNPLTYTSKTKTKMKNKQFFFAGRLNGQKGPDLLINAFEHFCKHNKDWTLVMAGDGVQRKTLINTIWRKKLQDRVRMLGYQTQMRKNYLESSVYLMSSRFEGWGLVVTEAFEFGLPVIAFDITPLELMIETGVNGVLVEKENTKAFAAAMLKLANDHELRYRMSLSAAKKATEFSINKICSQWEALIGTN